MAAKKDTTPKTAGPAADKKAALETALAQIEKQFGKGAVMKLGANVTMQVDAIPTGSLGLDLALGIGGVPRGRIVEVYGPESSGKTTLALQILAEAQKMGGEVAFIDVEHALDPTYAAALGVDIDSLLVSQPDTGEQAMEICEALVRSGAVEIIVIDSVAALVPQQEIEAVAGRVIETLTWTVDRLSFQADTAKKIAHLKELYYKEPGTEEEEPENAGESDSGKAESEESAKAPEQSAEAETPAQEVEETSGNEKNAIRETGLRNNINRKLAPTQKYQQKLKKEL